MSQHTRRVAPLARVRECSLGAARTWIVALGVGVLPLSLPRDAGAQCIDYGAYAHRVGQALFGTDVEDIVVSGDLAYVAAAEAGLVILDVTDPTAPVVVGSVDTPGWAFGVDVVGGLAYVGDGPAGFRIVDVSDPAAPTLRGVSATPGDAFDVEVSGTAAFVADFSDGLHVFDVSDPDAPTEVATVPFVDAYTVGLAVSGSLVYVPTQSGTLHVIEASDPALAYEIGSVPLAGIGRDVVLDGDIAYVAGVYFFETFDVSDPTNPTALGSLPGTSDVVDVAVSDGIVYAALAGGICIMDVTDPSAPEVAYEVDVLGEMGRGIDVASGTVYVTVNYPHDEGHVETLDVAPPVAVEPVGFIDAYTSAYAVAVVDDNAFLATPAEGLAIVDVSDPTAPTVLLEAASPASASDVEIVGPLAYVAALAEGLVILDVSNPLTPVALGSVVTPGSAAGVDVVGTYAYVADDLGDLQVIDVSDPNAPAIVGSAAVPGQAWRVDVVGTMAYVARENGGLEVVDVGDPSAPLHVAGLTWVDAEAHDIEVVGSTAFIADGYLGLQIIDVSDPLAPVLVDTYRTPAGAVGVAIDGDVAYVSYGANTNHDRGIEVLDVGDPAAVQRIGAAAIAWVPTDLVTFGENLYVATAEGLAILPEHCDSAERCLGMPVWTERAAGPSPRSGHATAYDAARDELVLFGGFDGTSRLDDTWVWSGEAWSERMPAVRPPARSSASMVYDAVREVIVMISGSGASGNLDDTWEWDGESWTYVTDTGPALRSVGLAYDAARGVTVLYGGDSGSGRSDSTFEYDGVTWTRVIQSSPPGSRSGHQMVYASARGHIHMFGGILPGGDESDAHWSYDGATWTSLGTAGPSARGHHRMAYDADCDVVYVHGGVADGLYLSDAWLSDGTSWELLDDEVSPVARRLHSADVVPGRGLVVLGGDAGGVLGDVWIRGDALLHGPEVAAPAARRLGARAVPSPFRVSTSIRFSTAESGPVRCDVFDVGGALVRVLETDARSDPGPRSLRWDGRDHRGEVVPAGVYYYRLRAGRSTTGGRVVVVR